MQVTSNNVSYSAALDRGTATRRCLHRRCNVPLGSKVRCLLQPMQFVVPAFKLTVVLGPTGSGKTLLLRLLAGDLRPTTGSLTYGIKQAVAKDWVTEPSIAYVQERDPMHDNLTVKETLAFYTRLANNETEPDTAQLAEDIVEALQLKASLDVRVGDLSDGQRQLVSIAAAISTHPRLLVADGMTSGLQSFEKLRLLELMRTLCDRQTTTVVVAVNDPQKCLIDVADHMVMMAAGQLVYDGPTAGCLPSFAQRTGEQFDTHEHTTTLMEHVIHQLAAATAAFHDTSAVANVPRSILVSSSSGQGQPITRNGGYSKLPTTDNGDFVIELDQEPTSRGLGGTPNGAANDKKTAHDAQPLFNVPLSGKRNGHHTGEYKSADGKSPEADLIKWNVRTLAEQWREEQKTPRLDLSRGRQGEGSGTSQATAKPKPATRGRRAPACVAIWTVTQRMAKTWWRSTADTVPLLTCFAFLVTMLYVIWPTVHRDQLVGTTQIMNLCVFMLLVCSVMLPHAMTDFWQRHRACFAKEYAAGLYGRAVYILAHSLWSTMIMLVASLLLATFLFRTFVPHGDLAMFVSFVLLVLNHTLSHAAVVEMSVFLTGSAMHVHYYAMAVAACSLMFSGFVVAVADLPAGVAWISQLSYTKHALVGITELIFDPDRDIVDQLYALPDTPLPTVIGVAFCVTLLFRFLFALVVCARTRHVRLHVVRD